MERSTAQRFLEDEASGPLLLLPCPTCFRTFKPDSLERHKLICEKVLVKKRKVFDSSKQRGFQSSENKAPAPSTATATRRLKLSRIPTTDWREKHLDLIRSVREVRSGDYNRCPYCERNFGLKAYDRHVDWCKEQRARIPKSPPSSEAKERWEARTKYRVPTLRRSLRSISREKYSPSRQLSSSTSEGPSSLSGSRASLDSRPSSIISYNEGSSGNGSLYHSKSPPTSLERSYTGSNFTRSTNERRSLRLPSSTTSPVPLSHINNNRTSALRASLRMKNSTSWSGSLLPTYNNSSSRPATTGNLKSEPLPKQNATSSKPSKPSVLQLFTSAFTRSSPSSKVAPRNISLTAGRVGPEGVESKIPSSSCSIPLGTMSIASMKNKPPRLTSRLRRKVTFDISVTSDTSEPVLLPDKVRNLPWETCSSSHVIFSQPIRIGSSGLSYNPYLSAERQMKELLNDRPAPLSPATSRKARAEEETTMEQLEHDLKEILSEISQLGQQPEPSISGSSRSSSGEQLPKFCHACGSAYPDGVAVKFCCECGARRLYV